MKKNDDTRASIACVLWSLCFIAGMFIAAVQGAKPFGITLMLVSTLILALYMWADDRLEHKDKLHDQFVAAFARLEIEARKQGEKKK